jgi:hypothetical protein
MACGHGKRNRSTVVVDRPGPGIFCTFRDGLAGRPDSSERHRLLLRTTVRYVALGVRVTDRGVEGQVEPDVLRHLLPFGRRTAEPPAPASGRCHDRPHTRTRLRSPNVEPRSGTRLPKA